MSWKNELKENVILYVIRHGNLVREGATQAGYGIGTYSGYQDYDKNYTDFGLADHMTECTLDVNKSTYLDVDWYEFEGTFAEEPWGHRQGTDAVTYCTCGRISNRHWRYTGGLADLIKAITA